MWKNGQAVGLEASAKVIGTGMKAAGSNASFTSCFYVLT